MGEAIALLRRLTGLNQRALAARVDMHPNYFGAIERGAIPNPGLITVSRIAESLGVSIGILTANFVRATELPPPGRHGAVRPNPAPLDHDGPREMGSAIRLLRRRADLTQAQLGDASGVHRGLIASIEAGRKANPGLRTIVRIASGIDPRLEQLSDLVAHVTRVFVGEVTIDALRGCFPATLGLVDSRAVAVAARSWPRCIR